MAIALQVRGQSGSLNTGLTRYTIVGIGILALNATESAAQVTYENAGTLSLLRSFISANTIDSGTSVIRTRVNGSNGSMALSVGFGATGTFTDTTNTDSISANDEVSIQVVVSGASGTLTYEFISTAYSATTNTMVKHVVGAGGITTSASTTIYQPINGQGGTMTKAEADVKTEFNAACTLDCFQVNVTTNGSANTATARIRVNGGNGSSSISIGAGVTGILIDTDSTDSISANDDVNYSVTTGASTVSLRIALWSCEEISTLGKIHTVGANGATTNNYAASTGWTAIGGAINKEADETLNQVSPSSYGTASNLFCNIRLNDCATSTVRLRDNEANTALVISVTASTTGQFEDAVYTYDYTPSSLLVFQGTGGAGTNFFIEVISMTMAFVATDIVKLQDTIRVTASKISGAIKLISNNIVVSAAKLISTARTLTSESIKVAGSILKLGAKVFLLNLVVIDTKLRSIIKLISNNVVVSDTIASVGTFIRTLTDYMIVSAVKLVSIIRTFSNNIKISEILAHLLVITEVLTDSIVITGSKIASMIRTLTDSTIVSDTISKAYSSAKSEIIRISDAILKTAGKVLSSAINLADTMISTFVVVKVYTDAIVVADSLIKGVVRILTEPIKLSEVIERAISIVRSVAVVISDSITSIWGTTRTLTESIVISDTISKMAGKILTSAIIIIDSMIFKPFLEAVGKISGILFAGKIKQDNDSGKIDDITFNGKIK